MRFLYKIPSNHLPGWSYVATAVYLALRFVSFPGDWLLYSAAIFLFIHSRSEIYRHCTDETLKRKYAALGIGYFIFFPFSSLAWAFVPLLSLEIQSSLLRHLFLPWLTGLLYLVPATLYLVYLDRRSGRPRPPLDSR
jgi:hypothetical protein